jgi:hypothetical protein
MNRSAEFSQLVARAINHTTWNIPKIRDGRCGEISITATWLRTQTASTAMTILKMRFSRSDNYWYARAGRRKLKTKRNGATSTCITSITG